MISTRSRHLVGISFRNATAAVCIVMAACRDVSAPPPPIVPSAAVRTDSSAYFLAMNSFGYSAMIGMVYTNYQATSVELPTCNGPFPPLLQRWNGATWEDGWVPIDPLCLGPPIIVPPGGQYRYGLSFYAVLFGANAEPKFSQADPTGTYRAVWQVARVPGSTDAMVPMPIEATVSNSFDLRLPPGSTDRISRGQAP